MKSRLKTSACLVLLILLWIALGTKGSFGRDQGGLDYLTKEETIQVREAQRIDRRVKVFMTIAERRLLLVEDPLAVLPKDEVKQWGLLVRGSRADMLSQYYRAIEEVILNVEDTYDQNPQDQYLLPALTTFRQHTEKHLERLEALRSRISDAATRQILVRTLDDLLLAYEDAQQSEREFQQRQQKDKKK